MPIYKYRRWTQEEDRKLKKLYNKKTLNELAGIFDRNWNKVCRRALRLGLKKDKKIFGKWASKTQKAQFKNGERSNKGKRNPNWKGGNTSRYGGINSREYSKIHYWLKQFPKPIKCENENCLGISKIIEWAKIRGKPYTQNRKYFCHLCKSCHVKYDNKTKNYDIKIVKTKRKSTGILHSRQNQRKRVRFQSN